MSPTKAAPTRTKAAAKRATSTRGAAKQTAVARAPRSARTVAPLRVVPPLTAPRRARPPAVAERTLDSGLRVLAVRRPGVPLVELRLRIPFAGKDDAHVARAHLLAETLLSGTAGRGAVDVAAALQALGGGLSASVDPDRLVVSGNALATGLPGLLDLLAEVLTTAAYPKAEVVGERDRLVERLHMARSQPSVLVREALAKRLFAGHPYAHEMPAADAVADVKPGQLRKLHERRVVPSGSVLVLVGDVTPSRALDRVEAALEPWASSAKAALAPAPPAVEPGPLVLVDRPGSVQSSIRVGGPALRRDDPGYAALQLANLVFGGYFSSRYVKNIREDKGYTYSPHSVIEHAAAGSTLVVDADVATEVTAPALLETAYELGRIATLPVEADELEAARQYAIGTLALSVASQAGLASTIAALAGSGLGVDWLREHPQRLAAVTADDLAEQAGRFLAPSSLVTVVLGDAAVVEPSVARLGPVTRG